MSWSAYFTVEPGMNPEEFNPTTSNVDGVPEHLDQYREALASVFGILVSGVVGDPNTKTFSVQVGGHGNEDHEPDEDGVMSNDFISINISQKTVVE